MYFVLTRAANGADAILSQFDEFGGVVEGGDPWMYGYRVALQRDPAAGGSAGSLDLGAHVRLILREETTGEGRRAVVEIQPDCLGLEPVFYHVGPALVAASNSLWLLAAELQRRGIGLSVNPDPLLLHLLDTQVTLQLTSSETLFREIRALPARTGLRIPRSGPLAAEAIAAEDITAGMDYATLVTRGAECAAAMLRSVVAQNATDNLILSLSGGRDSRAVLAACRYLMGQRFNALLQVRTGTEAHQEEDRCLAMALGARLGFPVNGDIRIPRNLTRLSPEAALTRWLIGNAGFHYAWDITPAHYPDSRLISLRGGQANAAGDYGSLTDYAQMAHQRMGLPLAWLTEHFREAALCPDGDPEEVFDRHYLQWRYRIHYGRPSATASAWALNVDPLINPYLDQANLRLARAERIRGRLAVDLIAAFDASCFCLGFSTKGAAIDRAYIEASFLHPLGLGPLERSPLHGEWSDNILPSARPAESELEGEAFLDRVTEIMVEELAASRYFSEVLLRDIGLDYARLLHNSGFDRQFIAGSRNQFAKLHQQARLLG